MPAREQKDAKTDMDTFDESAIALESQRMIANSRRDRRLAEQRARYYQNRSKKKGARFYRSRINISLEEELAAAMREVDNEVLHTEVVDHAPPPPVTNTKGKKKLYV